MATNSNQTRGAGQAPRKKMTAKQRAARKRRKIIIFAVEIVVLLAMAGVLYTVVAKGGEGPSVVTIPDGDLGINQPADENQELPKDKGYWNIALFGLDATNEKELMKGSRSDSIMIASVNMNTGDIKLVSVYRDTYLNIGNDRYTKCNGAYNSGGGAQAVKMLNSNLDMDITDFVAVGYEGVKGVVDGLGGVYIDVDDEELKHINNYQYSIAEVLKCDYKEVKKSGYQLLDGMQATAYCRIRYTAGNDFKRAARQREVLKAIEEQAKKASLATLTDVFTEAMQHVVTTLKTEDLIPLLSKVNDYRIVDEGGFPEESMRATGNIGSKGSCVIPSTLESNVEWLHQFLFESEDYTVSDTVKSYSKQVEADTAPYLKK